MEQSTANFDSLMYGKNGESETKSTPSADTGGVFTSAPSPAPSPSPSPTPDVDLDNLMYGGRSSLISKPEPISFSSGASAPETTNSLDNLMYSQKPDLSEFNRSEQPQQIQVKDKPEDPNAPWYEKLWNFANAPLIDDKNIKNWFGADVEHWTGWGRGLLDLAEGLTSPLSIGLMVGTFGTSSLVESGGMAALKAAGMSAEEIADVVKGSNIMSKALKMGASPENALTVAGENMVNKATLQRGLMELSKAGLKPESMLAQGIVRRTGSAMLRQAGVDAGLAENVATWGQAAMDAGFTIQNAMGAAVAVPKVLDAIKDGDYESAKRFAIDAAGSGAFAVMGGKAFHEHAGELMTDAEAQLGLRVKPSEENLKLMRILEPVERERIIAGEKQKVWEEQTRKDFKDVLDSSESELRARFYRESDKKIDLWHDAIAKAAGRETETSSVTSMAKAQSDTDFFNQAKQEWLDKNPGGDYVKAASAIGSRAHELKTAATLPKAIQELVDSKGLKDKPAEYIDKLLAATDRSKLTDREIAYSKHVGDHFDETGVNAVGKELLPHVAEDYVTRVWKDPENDVVRKFKVISNSGDFPVNTSMARKRIFDSTLEGLLKGYELKEHDMVALAAHNGNTFANVAAVREALQRLRGAGARASDGRPMATLSGAGHVLEGTDEEGNPVNVGTIVNPKAVQSIRMADKVVEGLKKDVLKTGIPKYAYRLRDIGDQGVTSEGHAQLTTNFDEMARWKESRSQNPQEIVRIPIDKLDPKDFKSSAGPNGGDWLTLNRDLKENELEKIPFDHKPETPRKEFTQLDRLIKEGKVVKISENKKTGEPIYAWTAHDYSTVNHPSFKGWKVPTGDTEGNPVYVMGDLKVHPEAAQFLKNRFEPQEGLTKKIPGMKTAMAASREAKGWLLAFSPFHFIQEGLRAIMTGISPIGNERFNPENPMHVLAAEKGVWEFKNYQNIRNWEDGLVGHSKIMSKIPVLREIQSWTQSMLFDRYIPGLKLRAFERMYAANERLHPDWTKSKIAEETAMETNERFGGIPYKRIGRSAAAMDVARLVALAPDWLESEMRFMKRTFGGDEGKLARRDVAKMTLGLWATARILNYLVSGKLHNEAPFGVAYKDDRGKENIYSVRTLPTDMLHAASDPVGFMNGRTAPLLRSSIQTFTGRDSQGKKMSTNGIFVNLMRNVSPIGPQDVIRAATGDSGLSPGNAAIKWGGATVSEYQTNAQKMAAKLVSERSENGVPLTPDKLRRSQMISELEDRLRTGRASTRDVSQAIEAGTLHVDEAKKVLKLAAETQNMDHEQARLYSRASKLPFPELIDVFDAGTNEERMLLSQLMVKKKTNYLRKVFKEMSPAERASDKSYTWIKKNFPPEETF